MARIQDIDLPYLEFGEAAAPGTPASGVSRIYVKSDGLFYSKDDAGTETLVSGGAGGSGMATDPLWDAAGDLAVGSGANTAARLAIGATNGMALQRVSGAVAWALPSGHEMDYVQITSAVAITATTEAGANTVVTGSAVTYDGSTTVMIDFFSYASYTDNVANGELYLYLYDGATSLGFIGVMRAETTNRANQAICAHRRLTPSAAAHTYSIRASISAAGDGQVGAGAGGAGNGVPAFIRITKV